MHVLDCQITVSLHNPPVAGQRSDSKVSIFGDFSQDLEFSPGASRVAHSPVTLISFLQTFGSFSEHKYSFSSDAEKGDVQDRRHF